MTTTSRVYYALSYELNVLKTNTITVYTTPRLDTVIIDLVFYFIISLHIHAFNSEQGKILVTHTSINGQYNFIYQ